MAERFTYQEAYDASLEYFGGNELAANVFVGKYALRDNEGNYLEKTPRDMHRRIAKEFARIEKKKYKDTNIKPLTEDEIFDLLDEFKKIIPQGSPMYGIGNNFQYVSLGNCFSLAPPEDSYGGICRVDEEIAQISKRRGGVGVDISTLRPNKTPTTNSSGTSTGIIPFMCRFSNTTREVGQKNRRGASIQTISIHHPESVIPWDKEIDGKPFEVEIKNSSLGNYTLSSEQYNPNKIDFITSKYDETKVTGSNISVRLTDEFLKAVENESLYEQRWPIDSDSPRISKQVDAKKVWDKIINSAFRTAEPGILLWDNILRESLADCYAEQGFKSVGVNPCSELILAKYNVCILLLTNLFHFVKNPFTKQSYFDFESFYKNAKISQRLADDLIDLEEEKIKKIIKKIKLDPEEDIVKFRELNLWEKVLEMLKKGRRTGTGITALGDTIAALGLFYGSEESIEITKKIFTALKFAVLESSSDIAKGLGAFPIWNHEQEKDNPFLNRIKDETVELSENNIISGKNVWNKIKKYGRRNIGLLTLAPAGSVSLLAKLIKRHGTSSGMEPQYAPFYTRKKKINANEENVRIDSVDQNGDKWQHFKVYPAAIQEWMEVTGEKDIEKSPWHNACALNLQWEPRVEMQATIQKNIDHSISSTVNLSKDTTVGTVKKIYEKAWESGLKGITVYRDGCRTGVLTTTEDKKDSSKDKIEKNKAPKRPKELPCNIHHTTVRGEEYFVIVGLFGDDPYEVFAGKNGNIPRKYKTGILKKAKRGVYSLILDKENSINNLIDFEVAEEEAMTRMISTSLRHGADISFIVHQLEKTKGDLTCFAKSVARTLKKYINDGEQVKGEECQKCQGTLIRQDGCKLCVDCGWSACN